MGDTPFDDKHTPRDHYITALFSFGEGYHNFHHQFPMDYRNGVKWYHWDPTKWCIALWQKMGLASHLRTFPDNEIKKAALTMKVKLLREIQDDVRWPIDSNELPVISWESCEYSRFLRSFILYKPSHLVQEQSLTRPLVLVSGFIHDVSNFIDQHPGGLQLLSSKIGKDATAAFHGGVYEHSNAAHNVSYF